MTSIAAPAVAPRYAPTGLDTAPPQEPAPALTKSEANAIAKEESKFTEFLVLLDDQANREVGKAFAMPVGDERRQYVAKTLIDNMAKTQGPLWKVLDGLQASGHVSERRGYTPLWIQNAIVVYGDETAESVMSSAAGVAQAIKSATHVLDTPGSHVDQLAGLSDAAIGAGAALADLPVDIGGGAKKPSKSAKPNLANDPQWNLTRIGVDKARADGLTGKGVTVGVIDTGLDVEHPFLLSKYRGYDASSGTRSDIGNWYDSVTTEKSPVPVDKGLHGTHVAGTILGEYGGVQVGVAPDAKLVAARGLGEQGGTDGMLLSSFQNMVAPRVPTPGSRPGSVRVVTAGPDIINNSWGSDDGTSISYMNALRNMDAMGIINVFAAGNDGEAGRGTIGSPGSNPHIITVGAMDRKDKIATFSSRGPNPLPSENGDPVPFIAMPGVDIRSTIPGGELEAGWNGTSMAAPAGSGVMALIQQAAQEATGRKFDTTAMKEVLRRAAQDLGKPGIDDEFGHGVVVADNLREVVAGVAKDLGLARPEPKAKAATK
ncbi:MAG: serine protease [Thermoleophilia bacterium]|nr:serine protease [Thermoleophilia bacterium]MCZ4496105.1 serine protease [Thermoleophilia bacterium]